MQCFYDANGGCFGGSCLVLLEDGSKKMVKDIAKGDRIKNSGEVLAAVRIAGDRIKLLSLEGGLLITPNHPIKLPSGWMKPYQCLQQDLGVRVTGQAVTDTVYNFVLNQGHTMEINGITCATFGHGLKGDNIEHAYFGTQLVTEDLKRDQGWQKGQITLQMGQFVRKGADNRVCGISQVVK